jgi:ribonuclease BN (tRNA processing enzyme)
MRLEHGGRTLVYSGDTGACDALVELAAGADVLLCESTWPHVGPNGEIPPAGVHLSGREAGEHAAAAGVGRLLLTHIAVWNDPAAVLAEAKAAFDGPVDLVSPGETYQV